MINITVQMQTALTPQLSPYQVTWQNKGKSPVEAVGLWLVSELMVITQCPNSAIFQSEKQQQQKKPHIQGFMS